MAKPKISDDWLAGCAGCEMSLLDIDERIVQLVDLVNIRSTPITDMKVPDEDGVDVGILTGAINNSYNEEVAHTHAQPLQDRWWRWATAPCSAAWWPCATSSSWRTR